MFSSSISSLFYRMLTVQQAKKRAADQIKKGEKKLAEDKAALDAEIESLKTQLALEK